MSIHFFSPAYLHYLSVMAGRALIIFLYLILLFRVLGKRQLGQLNLFDLAAVMGVTNAVQNGITQSSGNLSVGITAALVLLITCRIAAGIAVRFPSAERKLTGTPTVLIFSGKVRKLALQRERISAQELQTALRSHGLEAASQVKLAVLELDGSISVVPREEHPKRSEDSDHQSV